MPDWRADTLKALGLPATPDNVIKLTAWQRAEGGGTANAATFNPLNTTRGSQFPSINSVGVRAFPNYQTGIKQTADTLRLPFYAGIRQSLAQGNAPLGQFAQAVYSSPWGTKRGIGGVTPAQVAGSTRVGPSPAPVSQPAAPSAPPMDAQRQALLSQVFSANNALIGVDTPPAITALIEQRAQSFGGTTKPPVSPKTGSLPTAKNPVVNKVLQIANQQIGKPYIWGAESPAEGGFDCSGLLDYAFRQAGVQLPGGRLTTWTAANIGRSVKGQQIRPGDWLIVNGGKHIVMAAGGGKVIAAPHKGEVVQYQPISRFANSIVDIRRVV